MKNAQSSTSSDVNEKQCTLCEKRKSLDDFARRSRNTATGRDSWCRKCRAARHKKWYELNRKKPPRARATSPFIKLTEDEWEIRKALSKERAKARIGSDKYRQQRRLTRQKRAASKKIVRHNAELQKDLELIQKEGVRWKRSHHKVCPLLRAYPAMYADAQRDQRRKREAGRDNRSNTRRWKKENPGKVKIQRYRRRALVAGTADLTEQQWQIIKVAYRHRCAYCGERKPLTQDHVLPISKGGHHTASNIVPACRSCNSSKGARLPIVDYQPHLIA